MAQGGEIFVLKMPIVKLMDLANIVVDQTCHKLGLESSSISVEEIGLRPGEKMYEELMTEEESRSALETDSMFIIRNSFMEQRDYINAAPAKIQSYSSHNYEPMEVSELKLLLDQL
ncbi:UDP-N-acetylglucosamine 4,6-dehydratase [compost metagenome]